MMFQMKKNFNVDFWIIDEFEEFVVIDVVKLNVRKLNVILLIKCSKIKSLQAIKQYY